MAAFDILPEDALPNGELPPVQLPVVGRQPIWDDAEIARIKGLIPQGAPAAIGAMPPPLPEQAPTPQPPQDQGPQNDQPPTQVGPPGAGYLNELRQRINAEAPAGVVTPKRKPNPSDHMANELNAQELQRIGNGPSEAPAATPPLPQMNVPGPGNGAGGNDVALAPGLGGGMPPGGQGVPGPGGLGMPGTGGPGAGGMGGGGGGPPGSPMRPPMPGQPMALPNGATLPTNVTQLRQPVQQRPATNPYDQMQLNHLRNMRGKLEPGIMDWVLGGTASALKEGHSNNLASQLANDRVKRYNEYAGALNAAQRNATVLRGQDITAQTKQALQQQKDDLNLNNNIKNLLPKVPPDKQQAVIGTIAGLKQSGMDSASINAMVPQILAKHGVSINEVGIANTQANTGLAGQKTLTEPYRRSLMQAQTGLAGAQTNLAKQGIQSPPLGALPGLSGVGSSSGVSGGGGGGGGGGSGFLTLPGYDEGTTGEGIGAPPGEGAATPPPVEVPPDQPSAPPGVVGQMLGALNPIGSAQAAPPVQNNPMEARQTANEQGKNEADVLTKLRIQEARDAANAVHGRDKLDVGPYTDAMITGNGMRAPGGGVVTDIANIAPTLTGLGVGIGGAMTGNQNPGMRNERMQLESAAKDLEVSARKLAGEGAVSDSERNLISQSMELYHQPYPNVMEGLDRLQYVTQRRDKRLSDWEREKALQYQQSGGRVRLQEDQYPAYARAWERAHPVEGAQPQPGAPDFLQPYGVYKQLSAKTNQVPRRPGYAMGGALGQPPMPKVPSHPLRAPVPQPQVGMTPAPTSQPRPMLPQPTMQSQFQQGDPSRGIAKPPGSFYDEGGVINPNLSEPGGQVGMGYAKGGKVGRDLGGVGVGGNYIRQVPPGYAQGGGVDTSNMPGLRSLGRTLDISQQNGPYAPEDGTNFLGGGAVPMSYGSPHKVDDVPARTPGGMPLRVNEGEGVVRNAAMNALGDNTFKEVNNFDHLPASVQQLVKRAMNPAQTAQGNNYRVR